MTLVPRELHLRGTQCYTDADFALAIELLASGEIIVDPLVTEMPLRRGRPPLRPYPATPVK